MSTTKQVLGTLITWMGQSANSPISPDESAKLLTMLDAEPDVSVAERCARIADEMPHRKGYSIAEQIRKEFGLPTPKDRPIDKWRRE